MNKYILILILIVLSLSSCGIDNNSDINKKKSKKDIIEEDVISNSKKYSFDDLYKEIIIDNDLEKKWNKELFKNFVGFFNNNEFGKEKYGFFNQNCTIQDNGKIDKLVGIKLFDDNSIKLFNNFEKISFKNLGDYIKNNKIIKEDDYIKNILYFNKNKEYFYFIKDYYEINNICKLFSGKIKSFKELSSGEELDYDGSSLLYYKNIPNNLLLSNNEYNKYTSTSNKLNNRLENYKGLLKIVNKFISSGYDDKYKKLFYKKFNKNLSPYYSYSEYSLYFSMKKYEGVMKEGFCNNFNKEYFSLK